MLSWVALALDTPPKRYWSMRGSSLSSLSNARMRIPRSAIRLVVAAMLMPLPVAPRADTFEEKAQLCSACHGENGIPPDKSTPVIWGQHQGYLYLQLRDYKRGTRKDDVMSPVVDLLKSDDMMALAEYFSHKRWPDLRQLPAPPAVAARALEVNGSVGCTSCHLAEYQGAGTQPRLVGQN